MIPGSMPGLVDEETISGAKLFPTTSLLSLKEKQRVDNS
jgi:hypothetical protein